MTHQSKKYAIGRWCRIGAWATAIFGVAYIVWLLFAIPNIGPSNLSTSLFFSQAVAAVLSTLPPTIFSFFVLYALGTACDHFFGRAPGQPAAPLNADYEIEESAL